MIRNNLNISSSEIEKRVNNVRSKHRLIEQATSLRKYKENYSSRKVGEIKEKYHASLDKNTKYKENPLKKNILLI